MEEPAFGFDRKNPFLRAPGFGLLCLAVFLPLDFLALAVSAVVGLYICIRSVHAAFVHWHWHWPFPWSLGGFSFHKVAVRRLELEGVGCEQPGAATARGMDSKAAFEE